MTRLHLAGVGGNPSKVSGLEGDPHLPGGDRDCPGPHPGNTFPVSAPRLIVTMSSQITIELATPPPGPPRLPSKRMEYSQLQDGEFKPNIFNATWVTGI